MKALYKTTLACAMAAACGSVSAETVNILDSNENILVTYSADSVSIAGGVISLGNGTYSSGTLPGTGGAGFVCDPATTAEDGNVCVGNSVPDPSTFCGVNTSYNPASEQCEASAPDTDAPTLSIAASPSSLADGVTSSTLTFTFSENVQGFSVGDISVSSGSVTGLSATSGTSVYTATYNRSGNTSGSVSVQVSSGSYQDLAGNSGGSGSRSLTLVGASGGGGSCTEPGTEVVQSNFTYGTSMGADNITPPTGNHALAMPFTTGSNPDFVATFDFNGKSWTSGVTRKIWISECAGGEPISTPSRAVCEVQSLLPQIKLGQKNRGSYYCQLDTNTQYYINFQNIDSTCNYSNGCQGILAHKAYGSIN